MRFLESASFVVRQLHRALAANCRPRAVTKASIVTALSLAATACDKAVWDEKLQRMCAQDGGVRIYQVVRLPREQFNEFGSINFWKPTRGEDALGSEYRYLEEQSTYREGNPAVWRSRYAVIRRSDGKLLGEAVVYIRRGGGFPSPMHDSSFACPADAGDAALLKQLFQPSS